MITVPLLLTIAATIQVFPVHTGVEYNTLPSGKENSTVPSTDASGSPTTRHVESSQSSESRSNIASGAENVSVEKKSDNWLGDDTNKRIKASALGCLLGIPTSLILGGVVGAVIALSTGVERKFEDFPPGPGPPSPANSWWSPGLSIGGLVAVLAMPVVDSVLASVGGALSDGTAIAVFPAVTSLLLSLLVEGAVVGLAAGVAGVQYYTFLLIAYPVAISLGAVTSIISYSLVAIVADTLSNTE